jgi:soluble lytic murein transglycosylase-like protein
MFNFKLVAGLSAALLTFSLMGTPAQASDNCRDYGTCGPKLAKKHRVKHKVAHRKMRVQKYAGRLSGKRIRTSAALAIPTAGNRGQVVALIKANAPRYGVPTWFALRIAKIESGFNPRARGAAGEYGVFQMKCATARGIGFRGNCGNLLNAATNVQFGLKHLSLAVRGSGGNLQMAASKHNGGLGRKRLVRGYVNRVF